MALGGKARSRNNSVSLRRTLFRNRASFYRAGKVLFSVKTTEKVLFGKWFNVAMAGYPVMDPQFLFLANYVVQT